MHGISLSVMPLDAAAQDALEAATEVAAWPLAVPVTPARSAPCPIAVARLSSAASPSHDPAVAGAITAVCTAWIEAEADLNALDARSATATPAPPSRRRPAPCSPISTGCLPQAEPGALCRALSDRLAGWPADRAGY